MAKPNIEPIVAETLREFAEFLERHMSIARTADDWVSGFKNDWCADSPNYGFMLRHDGKVVGGIAAIYADRQMGGKSEKFCNITSWCVMDSHRNYSMKLAMSLTSQPGFNYTDFSPTKVVAGVLQFLKFTPIPKINVVIPNFPTLVRHGRVVTSPAKFDELLTGQNRQIWKDHAGFPWLQQIIVGGPLNWCHVIFKRRRFKKFASADIIYVSDPRLFIEHLGIIRTHFFMRRIMTTQVEKRFMPWPSGCLPVFSYVQTGFNAKQYLSAHLKPIDIDYLYSETVALDL